MDRAESLVMDTGKHRMIKSKKKLGIDPNQSSKQLLMNESALSLANFETAKADESAPIDLASPDKKAKNSKKTEKNPKSEARPSVSVPVEDDLPLD